MIKRIGFISLWVLATLVATAVALAAVRGVAGQVVDGPDSQLLGSGTSTTALLGDTTSTSTSEAPDTSAATSTSTSTTLDDTTTSTTEDPSSTSTTSTPSSSSPPSSSTTLPDDDDDDTSTTSTTDAPESSTTSTTVADDDDDDDDDATTTTTEAPAETQVTTYQLVGGWVRIASSPGVVTLDGAGPNPGFTMNIDSSGPGEVDVDFRSDDHRSDFNASWEGGSLVVDIDEEKED